MPIHFFEVSARSTESFCISSYNDLPSSFEKIDEESGFLLVSKPKMEDQQSESSLEYINSKDLIEHFFLARPNNKTNCFEYGEIKIFFKELENLDINQLFWILSTINMIYREPEFSETTIERILKNSENLDNDSLILTLFNMLIQKQIADIPKSFYCNLAILLQILIESKENQVFQN